jgi:hypothetical protein
MVVADLAKRLDGFNSNLQSPIFNLQSSPDPPLSNPCLNGANHKPSPFPHAFPFLIFLPTHLFALCPPAPDLAKGSDRSDAFLFNLQSAICNLQSAICNLQSPIANRQSPIANRQSPICNAFYLNPLRLPRPFPPCFLLKFY